MVEDTYLTIKEPAEGLFKDRGSKFLAFAYPVSTEGEVSELHKGLKKQYYDARHHCYAFILGIEKNHYRASDDGEPSNSSGPPILNVLRSHNLTNILVVVVRYFGGTKLGIPGLINAYKTATEEVLDNAEVVEEVICDYFSIEFEYPQMNQIMRIIKEETMQIKEQDFQMSCKIIAGVRKSHSEKVKSRFDKLQNIQIQEYQL